MKNNYRNTLTKLKESKKIYTNLIFKEQFTIT